jgi:glycosyltransferase involved in cell wall biosynthesis
VAKKLKISVIVPTYNRRDTVMRAVESVLSQDTSKVDFEVIVSDDGSTDRTKDLFKVKRKSVHYFFNSKNKGVNAARNFAISKASGDYVLLLDSDDKFVNDAAEVIVKSQKQFGKINFFGTADVETAKKLYRLGKIGKITYGEWLAQKVSGEFTPIIDRKLFSKYKFDEDRFCFEGIVLKQRTDYLKNYLELKMQQNDTMIT